MADNSNTVPPGRLVSHFAHRDRQLHATGWSELWESSDNDLWDRGMPSPALIDLLASRPDLVAAKSENGRRRRALVPGCGKGYDVVMLALHGFDAIGLEVSPVGVETAKSYAEAELARPSAYNFATEDGRRSVSPGIVTFVCGDFFKTSWEDECFPGEEPRGFDLIYDYTFLCALFPEMRKDWAQRMRELLVPTGHLVCLEFPMYKDLAAPGPPWGLRGVHWNLLAEGGDGIVDEDTTPADSGKGPFERVAYIKPPRSYESGRGADMLSVWALKK